MGLTLVIGRNRQQYSYMPRISEYYHKFTMIKKRTASNLGNFPDFHSESVMAITLKYTLIILFIINGLLIYGCSEPPDDEQLLQQALKKMEKAAESKVSTDILDYLAEDFMGNQQFRKANIKGMLFLHFRRHKNVHIFLHDVEIQLRGQQATVHCQVILAGRGEKIMPEQARILEIESIWQKRDGDWRVVSASWKDPYYQY